MQTLKNSMGQVRLLAEAFNKNLNDMKAYNYIWKYYHDCKQEVSDAVYIDMLEIKEINKLSIN